MVRHAYIVGLMAGLLGTTSLAQAQTQPARQAPTGASVDSGEIIVTARKRNETALDTPVVVHAIGNEELTRRAITNIEGIARATPLVTIGPSGSGVQGAPLIIRGFSSPDVNMFGDQAVSFSVDGVQVSKSTVQRLSAMDMEVVEVLKGPQTLFFGKNSPAGVISVRTADPTPRLETMLRAGYEFNAREERLEGYVSGPVSDTLGVRLAGYFSHMDGYVKNIADPSISSYTRAPYGTEWAGRLTLKYEPSDSFTARLKVSYNQARDSGQGANNQFFWCALGSVPQFSTARDNCVADTTIVQGEPGAAFQATFPTRYGGKLFSDRDQVLASLQLDYRPSDKVTLTSVSGLYYYLSNSMINGTYGDVYARLTPLPERLKFRELSEEFRLNTDFDGPLNFAGGVFVQSTLATYKNDFHSNPTTHLFDAYLEQRGDAASVFGQLILKPMPRLEIAGGGRFSYEHKALRTWVKGVEQISGFPQASWNNFSPEITVSYKPDEDVNLFAAYKQGFLSGGYNGGPATSYTGRDLRYDPVQIKGFEGGIKARLFDRKLRVNLAVFDYDITNMQISVSINAIVSTANAGKARSRGAEFDATWQTPIEGLNLRGALSYNKARYDKFTFNCYRGQSVAQGCSVAPGTTGAGTNPITPTNPNGTLFTLQDLAGQRIVRSPDWGANVGFNYETTVGGLTFGLSGDGNYSSKFFTTQHNIPASLQSGYWVFDASARVGAADRSWELALIGRNLGDVLYKTRASETSFTGTNPGGPVAGLRGDLAAALTRGREIMLQVTLRPNQF